MKVKITQRFGSHQPGETIDVHDTTGEWLVGIGKGTAAGHDVPVNSQRVHPGTNGPDPLAGGDPTRRYGHELPKVERSHNQALPVPGSPIQYNAGIADDAAGNTGRPEAKRAAADAREAGKPAGGRPASGSSDDSAPSSPKATKGRKTSN